MEQLSPLMSSFGFIDRKFKDSNAIGVVPVQYSINQLKAGMRGINLTATVIWMGEIKDISTRFGLATFCPSIIEDSTGKINLNLWRDQIIEAKVGSKIQITNGFVRSYGDALELNVGRDGKVNKVEQ